MEKVLIAREGKVEEKEITPRISNILKENILVNLAFLDTKTFLLLLLTSEEKKSYSFQDLINLLRNKAGITENTEYVVERSLDILLDSGFLSAQWERVNDSEFERRFYNRNEIVKYLRRFREDIVKEGDGLVKRFLNIGDRLLLIR